MQLHRVLLASLIAATHGYVVPSAMGGCAAVSCAATPAAVLPVGRRMGSLRMDEADAAAAPAADAVSDFTEDLLEALTTDDEPLVDDEPAVVVPGAAGVALSQLESYTNAESISAMRSKYALHENDTGSTQVQVAVLTARIAYMTKHLQANKKDYASLRGLTAMVTRRRKLLEYLLREDLNEFNRITEELGIRTNQFLKPKLTGARGRRV